MHAVSVVPGPLLSRKLALGIALGVAAVTMLLGGCTAGPVPGRTASACRVNSVLYCDVDIGLEAERCQCVRQSRLRDVLHSLTRR